MSDFPYPGLRPFRRTETDIFFGREALTSQLIKRVNHTHFVAVMGPAGCGKTSLVRAGLLAGLDNGLQAGTQWWVADFCPSNRPFAHLADALLADETAAALAQEHLSQLVTDSNKVPSFLQASLQSDPKSLHNLLTDMPLPPNTKLLIVVDQFEALFTHYQQGDKDEAAAFIEFLLTSCEHSAVHVVITMRLDFIGKCAKFGRLPEAINQGLFLTAPLTQEPLQTAIEAPARVCGGEVEPALVTSLLKEISKEPEPLPLLQQMLMQMWHLAKSKVKEGERVILTSKHYQKIGKLKGALSKHADKAYTTLKQPQQKIAETLFRGLIERGKASDYTRHPVKLDEVAKLAKVPWKDVAVVVEAFRKADRQFLTPTLEKDLQPATIINISHESVIRKWQKLIKWAAAETESAEISRRLDDSARRWDKKSAELWHGKELALALTWREQPTALWAQRYDKPADFDLATRFLEASIAQQRRLKRRNILMLVVLGLAAGLIALSPVLYWQYLVNEENKTARTVSLFESQLAHATLLTRLENYAAAKQTLAQTRELEPEIPPARRQARNLLAWFNQLMGGESQRMYQAAESKPLTAVAVSFNGQWLAASGENGTLLLFDVKSGQLLKRLQGHTGPVNAVVFQPQGQWLASAGDDRQIILWSLPTGKKIRQWKARQPVQALAASLDGKCLASGGQYKKISLWNPKNGRILHTFRGHKKAISDLAFSPSGKLLASSSDDGTARLWQADTRRIFHILKGHSQSVQNVTFSPDGKWLATGSRDNSVRLWRVASGKTVRVFQGHQKTVGAVRFVANGRYLVSASDDSTLRVWDTQSGITLRVLQGHTAGVKSIATFEEQIFSASFDGTVRRWQAALPYQQALELDKEPAAIAIAPNGKKVAVGFAEGSLRLYALPERRFLWKQETAHAQRVQNLAFSPDGTLLASASFDGTAKLWQVNKNLLQEQQTFSLQPTQINAVAFSPDGNTLATAGFDGKIGLFTVGTEQKRFFPAYQDEKVNSVSFDNSGTQLLSTSEYEVRRWDIDQNPPKLLQAYPKSPEGLAWSNFSPDSQQIASVGRDKSVMMYATLNKFTPYHLRGHDSTIFRVIFSPAGQQVATVSADATLRLWDLHAQGHELGRELFALRLPTNSGYPVPLWDFDFRCTEQGNCWLAVPLTRGKLMLYELKNIY